MSRPPATHEINGAVGSHAKIYAVAEMYEKHPNAKERRFCDICKLFTPI